jgi:hypothetical protein
MFHFIKMKEKLDEMATKLKEAGYIHQLQWVLQAMESEEEMVASLCQHSEKIALAFMLLRTNTGDTIRIFKNLRMCGDCHEATKWLSKIYGRTILVGDFKLWHTFKDGLCSCGDKW